jgi:rRNA maturation protein Nop10
MSKNTRLPNSLHYLQSVLQNKCPRCREGDLFVSSHPYRLEDGMTMHEKCMVCGQPTEIEVGFYYGTGYVSYALSVAFIISSFVAWKVLIGVTFAIDDNRIFYWMGTVVVTMFALQPLLMRLSRSLWLSWFVRYDPDWREHPRHPHDPLKPRN